MEPIIIRGPGLPLSYASIIDAKANASDVTEALALKEDAANKGQPGGYPALDGNGKVPTINIPAVPAIAEYPLITGKPDITVGDNGYGATFAEAITAIGVVLTTLIIPPGNHVGDGVTVPSNVFIKVEKGAIFTVANEATFTINGAFECGLFQCFSLTGTGVVSGDPKVPHILPQWFGALGDSVNDDTSALNNAATLARAAKCRKMYIPPPFRSVGGYKITATVDLTGIAVEADGVLLPSSTFLGIGAIIGNGNFPCRLEVRRNTIDWTSGTIGIKVCHMRGTYSQLSATGHAIGILIEDGSSQYTAYNTFSLGFLTANKTGLKIAPSITGAFCNENLFIGGEFGGLGLTPDSGIELNGSVGEVQHNVFLKPSFETQAGYPIVFDKTTDNYFYSARHEHANAWIAKVKNYAQNNYIHLGSYGFGSYPCPLVDYTDDGSQCSGNIVCIGSQGQDFVKAAEFDIEHAYHDGSYVHFPGAGIMDVSIGSSYTTMSRKLPNGGLSSFKEYPATTGGSIKYLEIYGSRGVGWRVDFKTSYYKALRIDSPVLYVYVRCFDSNGNYLDGTSPYYVQGRGVAHNSTHHFYSFYGADMLYFKPEVAYIFISVAGANLRDKVSLYTPRPSSADVTPGYIGSVGNKELPGHLLASSFPAKWHFCQGDTVWNDAAAGGSPGWVCVKRVDITLSANASGTDTVITVSSGVGTANGDIIGIKLNTSEYHFTTISSGEGTTSLTISNALPGTGVVAASGNAVVVNLWKAMANLAA